MTSGFLHGNVQQLEESLPGTGASETIEHVQAILESQTCAVANCEPGETARLLLASLRITERDRELAAPLLGRSRTGVGRVGC